ncbi:MAG: GGDEF domain-containing protein [Siculibacillus sp.]|nr:GGDEF domain-containing protein [Siculibacillus sp.]
MNDVHERIDGAVPEAVRSYLTAFRECPAEVRRQVRGIVLAHRIPFIEGFYAGLEQDEDAARFLPGEDRRERIIRLLADWFDHLFSAESEAEVAAVVAYQKQIGEVHARIGLPPDLMVRGMSALRSLVIHRLVETTLDRVQLLAAADWVGVTMDVSRAVIITSFVGSSERIARTDEAYRLFALAQNLQVERERQRAWLMEWSHSVLLALHRPIPRNLPPLAKSEFGRWFRHKGLAVLDGAPEVPLIEESIRRIDEQIVPRLALERFDGATSGATSPTELLDAEISAIKFHLNTVFEIQIEVENGRDPLTRLLSRRFVPIVLGREVAITRKHRDRSFAVALLDLDEFKSVNDQLGHDAGDVVLQYTAATIANELRAGDFAFRYGGEEFLICLTDVTDEDVGKVLEKLRKRIAGSSVPLPNGQSVTVTASIGAAVHDDHPDYQQLISRADVALYRAKSNGRNRVEIG